MCVCVFVQVDICMKNVHSNINNSNLIKNKGREEIGLKKSGRGGINLYGSIIEIKIVFHLIQEKLSSRKKTQI